MSTSTFTLKSAICDCTDAISALRVAVIKGSMAETGIAHVGEIGIGTGTTGAVINGVHSKTTATMIGHIGGVTTGMATGSSAVYSGIGGASSLATGILPLLSKGLSLGLGMNLAPLLPVALGVAGFVGTVALLGKVASYWQQPSTGDGDAMKHVGRNATTATAILTSAALPSTPTAKSSPLPTNTQRINTQRAASVAPLAQTALQKVSGFFTGPKRKRLPIPQPPDSNRPPPTPTQTARPTNTGTNQNITLPPHSRTITPTIPNRKLSDFIDSRIQYSFKNANRLRGHLLDTHEHETGPNQRFSFRVNVPVGAMEVRWTDASGKQRQGNAINISFHSLLFESDDPEMTAIDQIICHHPLRVINITKSTVHRRDKDTAVAIMEKLGHDTEDWMAWIEILTRIDQEY